MNLTPKQLHILQHSLGLDQFGRGREYRNHYVAGAGHHSWEDLLALENAGLMYRRDGPAFLPADDVCFHVSDFGRMTMHEQSPSPPKLNRSQQTYRDYLGVAECFNSFGHYLAYQTRKRQEERYA